MGDKHKDRDQLIAELEELRVRLAMLESSTREFGQAREALRESERLYNTLVNVSPDAITITDLEGKITFVSPRALQLHGCREPGELLGKSAFELIAPEDREKALRNLHRTLADDYIGVVEYAMFKNDGSRLTVELNAALIKNSRGEPKAFVAFTRDITERKEMERELQARNEELAAFSHTISHDLRTPLSVIEGYAKTALEADDEGRAEAERDCLESILRGSRRISSLIESLLAYAMVGGPGEERECLDPWYVIQEVLLDYEELLKDGEIETRVERQMPTIRADCAKFRQVISNLVDNAIKYMGHDNHRPSIEIGAVLADDEVTFHVRDSGICISPDDKERIFEPFKRLEKSDDHGLGIGLSTVKRAVVGWGGKVWVESKAGNGSTFYFTAPAGNG